MWEREVERCSVLLKVSATIERFSQDQTYWEFTKLFVSDFHLNAFFHLTYKHFNKFLTDH